MMNLYLNGQLVGELSDYGYETPWATARLLPLDADLMRRLAAASHFLAVDIEQDWGALSREDEDREYARRLAAYAISESDVELLQGGAWEIANAAAPQLQGPISIAEVDERGWVTWRWM